MTRAIPGGMPDPAPAGAVATLTGRQNPRREPSASPASLARRLACALAIGCAACLAQAEPLTFTFAGSVTQDPFGLSSFGAPVSGSYTFDSAALDAIADAASGSYTSSGPAFGFAAFVDGIAYATAGSLNIGTQVVSPGLYLVTGIAGDLVLELTLRDMSGLAVANDALPLFAPTLSMFAVREFRLFSNDAEFVATLDRLEGSVSSVAEPGTTALFAAGIGAIALSAARRRTRRCRNGIRLAARNALLQPFQPRQVTAMKTLFTIGLQTFTALLVALAAPLAMAVDGVVLIDQNRALAGGVTPGDTAGFPITITQPGSYRLASNLMPPAFVTAIEITVPNVTIDLNGYSVISPPHVLRQGDVGIVFVGTEPRGLTIKNGGIDGYGEPLRLGGYVGPLGSIPFAQATLKNLYLTSASGSVGLGPFSRVESVVGPSLVLLFQCPSIATNSAVVQVALLADQTPYPGSFCRFVNNASLR